MPGPMLTVTISESVHRGPRVGPLMIFGHGALELLVVVAMISGLAPLMSSSTAFITISLLGGTILCWMAVSMLRSLPSMSLSTLAARNRVNNLIVTGALLSIINPYWLLWWATIGLGYIIQAMKFGIAGIVSFFIGHFLADLAWHALVSYGISRGRHFITDTHYRILIGSCGSFLLVFSGWFLYSGINRLIQ